MSLGGETAPSSETVEIDGLRVALRRAGDGPPIVLLHGIYGDSRYWEPQLEALSDEFTVIAWDAPGAGGSEDPPASFGIGDYAHCLAGLIDHLGLSRPHLCALSFSGGIALELYRHRAGVISSLILVAAYAGWRGSVGAEGAERRLAKALRQADIGGERAARDFVPELFAESADPELLERAVAMSADFHPDGLRVMARASAAADLAVVLPAVAVPTLVLHGRADRRVSLSVSERLQASIPGSRLEVIDGAGHMLNLEAPGEFNRLVRDFVRAAAG